MSNRRKIRPRKTHAPAPKPGPGESYVHQPAVALDRTVPGSIDAARQASHDALIDQLGNTRRSGIWWTEHYAGQAQAVLDDLYGDDVRTADLARTRDAMRNPSAVLVMAWCIARTPDTKPEDSA